MSGSEVFRSINWDGTGNQERVLAESGAAGIWVTAMGNQTYVARHIDIADFPRLIALLKSHPLYEET